jgi:predicted patatin/cPLA2 family phospholipase
MILENKMNYFNYDTLVLSGGGIKGSYFLKNLKLIDNLCGLTNIKKFVGSSVGGIVLYILALGFNINEMIKLFIEINFEKMQNINLQNLFVNYGLDNGEKFYAFYKLLLQKKFGRDTMTFKELYDLTGNYLCFTGTNLNKKSREYFSPEETPDLDIILGLRITTCIPPYFTPIILNGDYYIDGALYDNLPMSYIKLKGWNEENVIGMILLAKNVEYEKIDGFDEYLLLILSNFQKLIECNLKEIPDNVLIIKTDHISPLSMNKTYEEKMDMLKNGYIFGLEYFENRVNKNIYEKNLIIKFFNNWKNKMIK